MGRASGSYGIQLANLKMMCTLSLSGHTENEIASVFGFKNASSISRALNTPQAVAIMEEISNQQIALIHDNIVSRIENAQEEAFDVVEMVMRDGETHQIKLRAAESILDRGAHVKDPKDKPGAVPTVNVAVTVGGGVPTMDLEGNESSRDGLMPIKVATGLKQIEDAQFEEVTSNGSQSSGSEEGHEG